jgi:hypothetical protein
MKRIAIAVATAVLMSSSLFAAQPKTKDAPDVTLPLTYTFVTINYPHNSIDYLLGINDFGDIVGYAGKGIGFTLPPSPTCPPKCTFKSENYPGAVDTGVFGINNNDNLESGGAWIDKAGNSHGFLHNSNSWWDVDYPGTTYNRIYGLNDNDVAAGFYYDGDFNAHAYIYAEPGNQYIPILIPGNNDAWATGINDYNAVVGTYIDADGFDHGFEFSPFFTVLDYPGAYDTWANGINNYGAISGYYFDDTGYHGFVYYGGVWESINDPNSPGETFLWGINDYFDLVGWGDPVLDTAFGFVAYPAGD